MLMANPFANRVAVAAVSTLLGMASISAVAWAMRVSPMVSELTTSGAGSTARIEVGNVGGAPLPFETLLTRMDVDGEGNIVETPADEDFLVFPPQGLVPVGGRQVVRVQWVGAPELPASQAYYLWVRQLPVEIEEEANSTGGAANIQVLYTMKALIVVAPPAAQANVELVSAQPALVSRRGPEIDPALGEVAASGSVPGVKIVVRNTGRRYALMSGANWNVEATDTDGQPFVHHFTSEEISQAVGVGYLQPLTGVRSFELPTAKALDPSKPVRVRFSQ